VEPSDPAGWTAHEAEHDDRRSAERLQCDPQLRASTTRKAPIRLSYRTGARCLILVRRPQLNRERGEGEYHRQLQ
jgi:hypothetical protein